MEKDDEVKGSGNWLQFGDFGYDPRTGRRNNIDPVVKPWISSYATFGNNPILYADPSGYDWFGSDDGKPAMYRNSSDKSYTTEDGSTLKNIGTTYKSSSTIGDITTNTYYNQDKVEKVETIDNTKPLWQNAWFAGANGAQASTVRTIYSLFSASLYPRFKMKANSTGNQKYNYEGSATRNEYVLKARKFTPEPYLSAAEDLKGSGTLEINPTGRYWYSNFRVNAFNGGIVLLNIYGLSKSVDRISNAPDKINASLDEANSWGAAWLGGSLAAEYIPGTPYQKIAYGFCGSVLGAVSKDKLQEMIINYNAEKDRNFTPFNIQFNNYPNDNTKTRLTAPNYQVGE